MNITNLLSPGELTIDLVMTGEIALEKELLTDIQLLQTEGTVLEYKITVENTSATAELTSVTLSDTLESTPGFTIISDTNNLFSTNGLALLAPETSAEVTYTYTATQDDVNIIGNFVNTATVNTDQGSLVSESSLPRARSGAGDH